MKQEKKIIYKSEGVVFCVEEPDNERNFRVISFTLCDKSRMRVNDFIMVDEIKVGDVCSFGYTKFEKAYHGFPILLFNLAWINIKNE